MRNWSGHRCGGNGRGRSHLLPECGTDFEVVTTSPLELKAVKPATSREEEEVEESEDGDYSRFFPARLRLHPRRKACPPVLLVLLFFVLSPQILIGAPDHAKDKDKEKPYALIAGTVWGPDDHPIYGIKVKIRRGKDKPSKARWEMISRSQRRVRPARASRRIRLRRLGRPQRRQVHRWLSPFTPPKSPFTSTTMNAKTRTGRCAGEQLGLAAAGCHAGAGCRGPSARPRMPANQRHDVARPARTLAAPRLRLGANGGAGPPP